MNAFEISGECSVSVEAIGNERHPIVIIDDFLKDPQALVAIAAESRDFGRVTDQGNFYPGVRAPAPKEYAASVFNGVYKLMKDVFAVSAPRAKVSLCVFSLATLAPQDLNPVQRLPHFDTANPDQFALLHYLFKGDFGGTSFYRHRGTGYEAVQEDRVERYVASVKRSMDDAPPAPGYVDGDTDLFERIAGVEARFNRLIIYRSFLLHSGNIRTDQGLSANPRKGRLTANMFIELC